MITSAEQAKWERGMVVAFIVVTGVGVVFGSALSPHIPLAWQQWFFTAVCIKHPHNSFRYTEVPQ